MPDDSISHPGQVIMNKGSIKGRENLLFLSGKYHDYSHMEAKNGVFMYAVVPVTGDA